MLHAAYVPLLDEPTPAGVPPDVIAAVRTLSTRRDSAPEDELEAIDAEIVGRTYWYVLRPDEIARAIIGPRWRVSVAQATLVLAACGEAGYDITGNGAPEHEGEYLPTRGTVRDQLIWEAAAYWAHAATQRLTYVSLGDCRGNLPRSVQYDEPGRLAPGQRAALTFGPPARPSESAYMRSHTRRLLVVDER